MQSQAPTHNRLTIYALSEHAITIEFGNNINPDLLNQISSFNRLLLQNPFPGFCSSVPAYATLSVFFNPVLVINSTQLQGLTCFDRVSNYLNQLKAKPKIRTHAAANVVTIPVCYGGKYGPDLEELAAVHHLGIERVIQIHSSALYIVYMIGFVPGFAYLGGMDATLTTPRKQIPRKAIPAGSVGIAGQQTGIYPLQTPGGWQIIGRTPLAMFNAHAKQPSLLKAGDQIKFKLIDHLEFEQYGQ